MKSTFTILRELFNFRKLLFRLSLFEVKASNQENFLGYSWEIFGPFIQVLVYWFIFGMGLRNGEPVNGVPYIAWLVCGFAPWLYITKSISGGLVSVHRQVNLVSKMSFPTSILPAMPMITSWITLVTLFSLIVVTMVLSNVNLEIDWLLLGYYLVCMFVFLYVLNLFNSTITVIVRDYRAFFASIMRVLFLATPIIWVPSSFNENLLGLVQLNPFYYIIEGFRAALLYGGVALDVQLTIYFWSITVLLLIVGSMLHIKYRDRFVDFM